MCGGLTIRPVQPDPLQRGTRPHRATVMAARSTSVASVEDSCWSTSVISRSEAAGGGLYTIESCCCACATLLS
jgi:hypothetical protein